MDNLINYFATNWIAILGLLISVIALTISTLTSIKSSKIESSTKLSEIHEKNRSGRVILRDIFQEWLGTYSKEIESHTLREVDCENDKESFMAFYIKNYHNQPNDKKERLMSNEIHAYLHELHHLWNRHLNNEFSETEIKKLFSTSLKMDSDLLMTYLEAHWKEHNELSKEKEKRFWHNVPILVERAKNWEG